MYQSIYKILIFELHYLHFKKKLLAIMLAVDTVEDLALLGAGGMGRTHMPY
jgi:hypothetical protein